LKKKVIIGKTTKEQQFLSKIKNFSDLSIVFVCIFSKIIFEGKSPYKIKFFKKCFFLKIGFPKVFQNFSRTFPELFQRKTCKNYGTG